MPGAVREIIKAGLRKFDLAVTRYGALEKLRASARASDDLDFLAAMPAKDAHDLLMLLKVSTSQLRQDLFVLSASGFKRDGFFVEFGAASGVELSNTYLLETKFGWRGILAEPARCWHARLRGARTVPVDTRCVWRESGATLTFNEAPVAELSTISAFSDADMHGRARSAGTTYPVETISLLDLLRAHNAPGVIDYLSLDTEGSELEILQAFDFNRYRFKVITCEHNYGASRAGIQELLEANGYKRVFEEVSKFDDWYVWSGPVIPEVVPTDARP